MKLPREKCSAIGVFEMIQSLADDLLRERSGYTIACSTIGLAGGRSKEDKPSWWELCFHAINHMLIYRT